jgi:AcrR family transcriptional regulator
VTSLPPDTDGQKLTKGERTRARLIDVAATCFAEHGYRATTFDQLVAASGLSRGAVHFHFRTKEDLALAVLTSRQDQWLRHVQAELAGQPDAASTLANLAPTLLRLHATDPTGWTMSVISGELAAIPALASTAAHVTTRWIDWLSTVIQQGQNEGGVRRDLDPTSAATVLFAAMDGLRQTIDVIEPRRRRRSAFKRHVETLSTIIQQGILNT